MLIIRLQRVGRKNEPAFRLVLTEAKSAAKKKAKEILGSHDFRKETTIFQKERIEYWLSQGVQVSDTAHNLLVSHKIVTAKKRNVLPKKTVPKKEVSEEAKDNSKNEAKKDSSSDATPTETAPVEA